MFMPPVKADRAGPRRGSSGGRETAGTRGTGRAGGRGAPRRAASCELPPERAARRAGPERVGEDAHGDAPSGGAPREPRRKRRPVASSLRMYASRRISSRAAAIASTIAGERRRAVEVERDGVAAVDRRGVDPPEEDLEAGVAHARRAARTRAVRRAAAQARAAGRETPSGAGSAAGNAGVPPAAASCARVRTMRRLLRYPRTMPRADTLRPQGRDRRAAGRRRARPRAGRRRNAQRSRARLAKADLSVDPRRGARHVRQRGAVRAVRLRHRPPSAGGARGPVPRHALRAAAARRGRARDRHLPVRPLAGRRRDRRARPAAQGAPTLAIVNDAASPLARAADWVLPLHAGEERSVAATKTYTAQLAAVALLVFSMAGRRPGPRGARGHSGADGRGARRRARRRGAPRRSSRTHSGPSFSRAALHFPDGASRSRSS